MVKLAIFASGSGTNAENLAAELKNCAEITAIYCNNPGAGVIARAERLGLPLRLFNKQELLLPAGIAAQLQKDNVDYIILAGFLLLVPAHITAAFADRIINIHPALLPAYGGKGMYGMNVHKAVIGNNEPHSGITIHLVNEKYDEGAQLFQARCQIEPGETPQSLAEKIHMLEHEHFPKVVKRYIAARSGKN
jgi:phosphoribosylglycinamide formyltransferase 1